MDNCVFPSQSIIKRALNNERFWIRLYLISQGKGNDWYVRTAGQWLNNRRRSYVDTLNETT